MTSSTSHHRTVPESELVLMACAAPRAGESFPAMSVSLSAVLCANVTLKSKLDSTPGFISAAFLSVDTEARAEIWVVGVLGDVFEFLLHGATGTAELSAAHHSAIRSRSFVQTGSAQQVQRRLSRCAEGDPPGHAVAGRGVVYYTMDMRTLSHGKIMAFLPGFQKVSPQMLLQETELKIERSWYVVLVVITKSDIENYNGFKLLEISVGVATSLKLDYNELEDEGGRAIVEALRCNTTLSSLGRVNLLGEQTVRAMSELMRYNTTLTSLKLDGNDPQAFRNALSDNTTLQIFTF
jgi:hypothetical protein